MNTIENISISKSDYLAAVAAGIITALFAFPALANIKIVGGYIVPIALIFILPVLWITGLIIGRFLAKFVAVFYQLAKFAIVGFLNTAIDFGMLNFISLLTGVTGGLLVGGVNIPGFVLAALNSYFWNKFWVFRKSGEEVKKGYSDFLSFFAVVIFGVIINGGIVVLLTTYVSPFGNLSPERWLNISKVIATAASLVWNFLGFKFLVFKSKEETVTR